MYAQWGILLMLSIKNAYHVVSSVKNVVILIHVKVALQENYFLMMENALIFALMEALLQVTNVLNARQMTIAENAML
jgi:hypothetical protein